MRIGRWVPGVWRYPALAESLSRGSPRRSRAVPGTTESGNRPTRYSGRLGFVLLGLSLVAGNLAQAQDQTPAPTITAVAKGERALTVVWTAPSGVADADITAYDVRRIETDATDKTDANWTLVADAWNGGPLRDWVTRLENDKSYDVQVRAVAGNGSGAWSDTATGTPTNSGGNRNSALELTLDVPSFVQISPGDSSDYFKFDLSAAATLLFFTNGPFVDSVAELQDSTGTRLNENDQAGFQLVSRRRAEPLGYEGMLSNFFMAQKDLAAGTYYLKVEPFRPNDTSLSIPYAVYVNTVTSGGDSRAGAKRAILDLPLTGRLDSATDADYFRFNLDRETAVRLYAAAVPIEENIMGGVIESNHIDVEAEITDSAGTAVDAVIHTTPHASHVNDGHPHYGFTTRATLPEGSHYVKISSPDGDTGGYLFYAYPDSGPMARDPIDFDPCPEGSQDDPLYGCQWHLGNTGQYANPAGARKDINVESVWAGGNLGAGVNIAIVDDGMYWAHDDLVENVSFTRNRNYFDTTLGVIDVPNDIFHFDPLLALLGGIPIAMHGTWVAGIIAARDNDIGVRGVAPRASIYGYNLLFSLNHTVTNRMDAMSRNAADTQVSNNSWGFKDNGWPRLPVMSWETAVTQGTEGGNDVSYVWAGGNGHEKGDNSNLDGRANFHRVLAVCGVNRNDVRSPISERGANLWVCGPTDGYGGPGLTTTDNYHKYFGNFGGTSGATPMVSGVLALVRNANEDLTWRDARLVLAGSARRNDSSDSGWETGALRYGSTSERYRFNHQYGFGTVDAAAAVTLADGWVNVSAYRSQTAESADLDIAIPDLPADATRDPVSSTIELGEEVEFVEFVEVNVDFDHTAFRNLEIELESPAGAVSQLLTHAERDPNNADQRQGAFGERFRFGSARHLGENAEGTWTLRAADAIRRSGGRNGAGSIRSWSLTVHGHRYAPGPPEVDTVTGGDKSLTVTWKEPGDTGVTDIVAYDLRHIRSAAIDKADADWTIHDDAWTSGDLRATVSGLLNGTQYDVRVRAVNGNGDGLWSATDTGTTSPGPPAQATGVTLSRRAGALFVSWDEVPNATGYRIQWKSGSETFEDAAADNREASVSGSATTGYRIGGLDPATTYAVRVISTNAEGTGPVSGSAEAMPAALPLVSIAAVATPVFEAAGAAATFALTRDSVVVEALAVTVRIDETGSLIAGAAPGTVTFAAGQATAELSVPLADDGVREFDGSTVTATVVAGTNYRVSATAGSAGVRALDDDALFQARFDSTATAVDEHAGSVRIGVTVRTAVGAPAPAAGTGGIAVSAGAITAGNPGDFGDFGSAVVGGAIEFQAGDFNSVEQGQRVARKTVSVAIENDRIDEADETFAVRLALPASLIDPPILVFGAQDHPSFTETEVTIADNDAAPSLALSVSASTIDEDGGTAMVTVSTGSGSTFATDQTVRLAVAGTATETSDYTVSGKTLTLPAGIGTSAATVSATLTGMDDDLDDDDETVVISGTHNGVAFGDRRTVTIEDDDDPEVTVSFAQSGYRAAEGGHVDVAVTLSAVPERQVSIPVEAEGADGADSADFSISPSSLSFGANETTRTVRVSAANDSAVDPGESVALGFGTPLPERISEGSIAEAVVAIRDTNFTFVPVLTAGAGTTESDTDTYTVSENSSALRLSLSLETPRGVPVVDVVDPVVVTLATRENAGSKGVDEDYASQRRAGTFGDYGALNRDLSFAPGDFSDDGTCGCARAEKAVSVDLFNDRVHERTEVFGLRLSRKSARLSVPSHDVTAKIAEDDAEPMLTLDANPGSIAEAGGASTVTVSTGTGSTFPAAQAIRLDLSGTATRGADYTIDATTLTLPAGMGRDPSSVTTTVRAQDDPIDDDSETVVLAASRDGVEFARRTIGIDDDDTGSTRVDLSVNPAQVREDAGATPVRVTASLNADARAQDTEVTVIVGAGGDSAVEGTDYEAVADLTVTIDAGETSAETTFRLEPRNNNAVDGAKTITVDGSVPGLAVGSVDLTLDDDDVASTQVTLTLDPLEVRENAASRTVRVTGTLDGGVRTTETVVMVTVGSGADSALEGTDYAEVPELELTIPPNRTDGAATFTLRPTNDRTAEGTETISVRGNVAGLTVTPTELAIADDDTASTRLDLSLDPSRVSEAAVPTEVLVTGSLDAGARTADTVVTVTVGVFTDSATEGLDYANVSTLQIRVPANETAGQTTFTLSPDNDAIAEGAETITVIGRAGGLTVGPAALTLSDNDTASRVVTLTVDPESVSEDTPEDVTVTATLNAGARAEDTAVRLMVGAAGDTAVPGTDYVRVTERTLTIPAGETSGTASFRLRPLDNDSADGARTLSVTGSTTVVELRIEPATGAGIALEDNDSPAVLVMPDTLTVVEAGTGIYTVAVQTRPTADVTVTITGVSGDLRLDKTSLVFTQGDWRSAQDVEVMAADDDDSAQDPDVTLTHRASGAAEYRGLRAELVVTIRENDPSLVFSETALRVPEGETATYAVALATVPTADVTVRITGVSGDLSLDKTELAYTPGDWDDAQTITVEAAQDDDTSTDAAVTLTHRASGGGYDGIAGTVRVTITEDDRGGGTGGGSSGGGSGGGSRNRPPVVTEPIGAQVLEIEGSVRIDATEHFRDPERRTMTFEAESADVSVATVEVDGSVVTVGGIAHGVTAVTVTAVDHRRLRVSQGFAVSVGRQVSFASAEVSAPEGSTAMLRVTINRPRDVATSLDYVVGPDDDPATVDADAADHDGVGGTVVIAAQAMEATIALAVHDDTDIEPPRETFAVTLQATEAQLQDFGLGVATVRVTIDEGVCDRTRQVRNALRRSLPCAAVSATDLGGRRDLDLANTGLAALRGADLSDLSGLTVLDLSGNALTSLPAGMFVGLGALGEVQLQDNPGAPFVLQLDLVRTDGVLSSPGPASVVARVREGAPFAMRAALSAVNGTLSAATALVPAGMTAGTPMAVVQDAAGATRVTLTAPAVPDTRCGLLATYPCFQGMITTAGGTLVLFKAPPEVTDTPSGATLAAEGDATRIDLSALFAASDGGALTYVVGSSDSTLATASVAGDTLTLASNEDGREGAVTITVTATDEDGLSVTLTFEVTVESIPRGLLRGWRRVLLEQHAEPRAAEVE